MNPLATRFALLFSLVASALACHASPSQTGQSGFIQMPSGRIEADGTLQYGVSYEPVYQSLWGNVAFLPWLEMSARFSRIDGVGGGLGADYGDYKDKAFDAKLRLWSESQYLPSVVVGAHDFLGTGIFEAQYVAAAKRFGNLDVTLGYGRQRIDGLFAGARYDVPALPGLSLTAEYNAFDYSRDYKARQSGVYDRDKGVGLALDYRWGWLGSQISWQDQRWGAMAYMTVPLQTPDFIPKLDEPEPYKEVRHRPSDEEWDKRPEFRQRLLLSLRTQDYARVGIDYREHTLRLRLTNTRISHVARAVGRAARTAVALGPAAMERLEIVYTRGDLPVATIVFKDVASLNAYYQGLLPVSSLLETAEVRDPVGTDMAALLESDDLIRGLAEGPLVQTTRKSQSGHVLAVEGRNTSLFDVVGVAPRVGFFFNDPSGALHYDVRLELAWAKTFTHGLHMDAALGWTVLTDMDEIRQPSNSRLPHVRSDIAKYRQGGDFKFSRAVIAQVAPLAPRLYGRIGAGFYEEMYAGYGAQLMYVVPGNQVAIDVAVDQVRQRDYSDAFAFLPYSTVTALTSVHVRLPLGLTTTLRGGRFLAGDEGVRFELKRRFRSGYEIGGWYTHTNANDTMTPGSPGQPYQDKGLYFSIPLNTLLTRDTPAEGSYHLRPWTRDGGQMVNSSLDLYEMLEKPLMLDFPELREAMEQQLAR